MIRFALIKDIPQILELPKQVNKVHYDGRPDIFKLGTKYSQQDIEELLLQQDKPILVWTDENDKTQGYCFCAVTKQEETRLLHGLKTLYIDDLCVDESCRGQHIGKELFEGAEKLAKELGCYNLTLKVWSCNPSALKFYQKQGLAPQKTYLEKIL